MSTGLSEVGKNPLRNPLLAASPGKAQARVTARPRVLHLVTSFEAGGTERQSVELLKRLDRQRYDLRLAALRLEGPFYEEIADAFPDIPEFRLTSFYNRNALTQLNRLRAFIYKEGVNIIHTHGFYDSLFGAVAGRLCGIQVIASQRHLRLSNRRVHDYGTRAIHLLAHRIIVNSAAIRDAILTSNRAAAGKIVVIHNGLCEANDSGASQHLLPAGAPPSGQAVEENRYGDAVETIRCQARRALCGELGLAEPVKLIGMVARLAAVKGHQYFLEAAAHVAAQEADVHFVLIGDGPQRSELEDQARRLGLFGRVHFLGDRKDARRLVSACDVSVLSSLSEGLPNTVMEAMSAGVPVIATAVGGTLELITDGETGFLVPPASASALIERMLFVLRHEAESKAIAERGRQRVKGQFSMRRMVESVESLYEEMRANL